jgi:hypothetical protein
LSERVVVVVVMVMVMVMVVVVMVMSSLWHLMMYVGLTR